MNAPSIWNLPAPESDRTARSPAGIIPVLEAHFGARPIRFLEIGVFEGGLFRRLQSSALNLRAYLGVDPYLGTVEDPYTGRYWAATPEATAIYEKSRALIEGSGHRLLRTRSTEFFETRNPAELFDVVYVDGDHRRLPALLDMMRGLECVADGGLLMVDDYANVSTPEVTGAFQQFATLCQANIARMGWCHGWLSLSTLPAPIVQSTVYLEPVPSARRVQIEMPAESLPGRRARTMRDRMLDLNLRSVVRRIRRLAGATR